MPFIRILLATFVFFTVSYTTEAQQDNKIRLGWQTPWATQGQLVMAMKYTNIPSLVNIDLEYLGFSFGGPLNKAALAGEVDVLLTADQPAMVLLSRNPEFRIVSRMMYNRVCIYVPVKSPLIDLADLSGKRILGPVGAAAERVALAAIMENGVDVSKLTVGNLDMSQQAALLSRPNSEREWVGTDALFGFDPLPAVFRDQGKARMIHCGKVVSVVVASNKFATERPEILERFLRGFRMSWAYFATHPKEMNQLFSRDSRLNVSDAVLDDAASIEPNRWSASWGEQKFDFDQSDYDIFAESNAFLIEREVIQSAIDMEHFIDLSALKSSREGLSDEFFARIQPKNPTAQ